MFFREWSFVKSEIFVKTATGISVYCFQNTHNLKTGQTCIPSKLHTIGIPLECSSRNKLQSQNINIDKNMWLVEAKQPSIHGTHIFGQPHQLERFDCNRNGTSRFSCVYFSVFSNLEIPFTAAAAQVQLLAGLLLSIPHPVP